MSLRLLGLTLGLSLFAAASAQADIRDQFSSLEVRTGAIYLQRSNFGDDVILLDGNSNPLLTSEDIQQGEDTGFELSLFGRVDECRRLEFRYFHLDCFHFGGSYVDPGAVLFNTRPFGSGLLDFPVAANVDYCAELTNFELNCREEVNSDVEFIWGIRHIRSQDHLAGFFQRIGVPGTTNQVEFGANNYLTGLQLGVDCTLVDLGPFSLESLVKVGVYHNQVMTSYTEANGAISIGQRKDLPAFVGEVQLTSVYHINDSASCRIGYQFLMMTNIASAPNQVTSTVRTPVANTVAIATDSPVYQGIFAQLDFYLYD